MIIVDLSSSITLQHRCYQQLTFIIVITIIITSQIFIPINVQLFNKSFTFPYLLILLGSSVAVTATDIHITIIIIDIVIVIVTDILVNINVICLFSFDPTEFPIEFVESTEYPTKHLPTTNYS